MFDYQKFGDRVPGSMQPAIEVLATESYGVLSARSEPTETHPAGRPGYVQDVVGMAEAAGLLTHPAMATLAEEFWVRDGTRSFWKESIHRRLPLLVNSAFRYLDAVSHVDEGAWVAQLRGSLGMYLAAIAGETIEYLNVYIVRLELDHELTTPWGVLRPGSLRDRTWIEEILADEIRLSVEWDRRNAILQVVRPVKWTIGDPEAERLVRHPNGIHYPLTDREAAEPDLVCLSSLLAGGHDKHGSVCWAGTYFLPFGSSGGGSWVQRDQIYESAVFKPHPPELGNIMERLAHRYVPERRLAVSRSISACDLQRSPVDGLVDCVIAWENLLSRSSSELTFKTAAAASTLMADDPVDRQELFRQFKSIYSTRSKIVHGSSAPTHAEASYMRRDAVELTMRLLAASLSHPADVWSMTSEQELERLILGT